MELGLENISRLLRLSGDPQTRFPAVLIAGTNGKGSVTSMLSAILKESGLVVGSFYSPHLFRVNERIRVGGEEIPSPLLDGILGQLKGLYGEAPFTYFEGMTAAAAIYFSRRRVDVGVFEVGLGGRLDATRLVDAVTTVITGISIDHHEHLGRTAKRILGEKLGIVRRGAPLVVNLSRKALVEKARRHADRLSAPCHMIRDEVEIGNMRMDARSMRLDLGTPERDYPDLAVPMLGRHQFWNAATAVRTGEILAERLRSSAPPRARQRALKLSREAVREGLSRARFPGRFQVLPGSPRVIMDVSHNEESLSGAISTLRALSPPQSNVILFAVQSNKELGRFPSRAVRAAREIILAPLGNGRGARADDLRRIFEGQSERGCARLTTSRSIGEAMRLARGRLAEDDTLLVCGSHLTVEEAVGRL